MRLAIVRPQITPLLGWSHRLGDFFSFSQEKTTVTSPSDDNFKRQVSAQFQEHLDYIHVRIQCLLEASVLVKRTKCKRQKNDLPITAQNSILTTK